MRGTPRYRTGSDPCGMPVVNWIRSRSASDNPDEKNEDFWTLTAKPERSSNSLSTCRTAWRDWKEPSKKIRRSSAKQR